MALCVQLFTFRTQAVYNVALKRAVFRVCGPWEEDHTIGDEKSPKEALKTLSTNWKGEGMKRVMNDKVSE